MQALASPAAGQRNNPDAACYAYAKTDYAGAPRSADDVHYMALSNLDGEYATIVDTASLLATLEE